MFRIMENSLNVPIDLSQEPAAFPEPTLYNWTRNDVQLSSPPSMHMFTYSTIIFNAVSRNDSGNYAVSATNFVLRSNSVMVGNDTGSFSLDVICKYIISYYSIPNLSYLCHYPESWEELTGVRVTLRKAVALR